MKSDLSLQVGGLSILESIEAGVVVQDSLGRIAFCNPSAERILSALADPTCQVIREDGSAFPEHEHPSTMTLRSGRPCRGVILGVRRADGSVIWLSVTTQPLKPDLVVTTFHDVTEQWQAEFDIKKSELLYRTLVEKQGEGVGIVDLEERFVFANPAGAAIFGVPAGKLVGRSLFDFVSSASAEVVQQQTRIRMRAETSEYEVEITRESDGARRTLLVSAAPHLDGSGNVAATFGVFRDITDRKKMERALQESEERLRLATEANHLGTWEVFPQTGKRRWSALTKGFFGFAPEAEISNEDFLNAVHPADRERVAREVQELLSPEHGVKSFSEFRVAAAADGQERWVASWGRTLFDEAGRPVRVIGVTQDITQRKRAEEDHERLQAQLLQAQKMESIGRLAGGVAHDFNNLLTVINGYSTLALSQLGPQDPLSETIREIRKAGEAAAALVRQLLAFGRKQLLREEAVNLNAMLSELEKTLLPLLGEQIEIVTSLWPSLSAVTVDRHQIEQVIMNLAVNARDAMPQGGVLTIETNEMQCGHFCRHCLSALNPGRYVRVTVRDTGTGMDEETRQHLFEPFFSTKSAGHGTGLGLATVHGIILQSAGHIDVESEVGHGTSFHIYLPAREAAPPTVVDSETVMQQEPRSRGTETILLVEDQPEVRRFTASLLEQCGYGVLEAGSAEEALSHFAATDVDLVLTDVVLPKMSGCELAAAVRLRQPGAKVLFMSGYSEEMLAGHAEAIRGSALIQKPFAPAALAEKVREVLGAN